MPDRATSRPSARTRLSARRLLRRLLDLDPMMTVTGAAMLLVLVVCLAGLALDPRTITGAPAWLKPAKFALSIAVYLFTLVRLISFLPVRGRLVRLAGRGTALALLAEMVIIALQVVRGATSHFNDETAFDAILWGLMGGLIVLVRLANLLVAVVLIRRRLGNRVFAWSLRLGLVLSLVGMAVAMPMVFQGGHSVGVADGGPGLPIVGWSTEGGDLRVAHFAGLHALQLLPVAGWLLASRGPRSLRLGDRLALLWTAASGYLGLILLLTWQALRGQPLIRPDALTLAALGALVAAVAAAAAAILLGAGRPACALRPVQSTT